MFLGGLGEEKFLGEYGDVYVIDWGNHKEIQSIREPE
jgi:hypothetical protein